MTLIALVICNDINIVSIFNIIFNINPLKAGRTAERAAGPALLLNSFPEICRRGALAAVRNSPRRLGQPGKI